MRRTSTSARQPTGTQSIAPTTGAAERSGLHEDVRAKAHREEPMSATAAETSVRESSWVTPRQAAAYLGVGVDTIYEACAAADLKHVKLGYRTIRLRREWIDIWAEKHATPAR
jgi:excisionase family DNA binding protein